MLDAHTWWKLGERYGRETVRDLVAHAGEHGACWVEEPVEPDDHEGYVDLAATGTPLAGGGSEETPAPLGQRSYTDKLQKYHCNYVDGSVPLTGRPAAGRRRTAGTVRRSSRASLTLDGRVYKTACSGTERRGRNDTVVGPYRPRQNLW